VPAEAISGKLTLDVLLTACLLAMTLMYLSRRFWRYGVRFYSGASA
jgi:ABC-type uncharacterized transport system permease subunit